MPLEFDEAKNARNIRERGISFERFADMDLETAGTVEGARTDSESAGSGCSAISTAGFTSRSLPTAATRCA